VTEVETEVGIPRWIRVGVWCLPLYGLLTFVATLTHQPDPSADFRRYSEYLITDSFLAGHLLGSIFATAVGLLGLIALFIFLLRGKSANLAVTALIFSVIGNVFVVALFGVAAFASPAIGRAYLAGQDAVVAVNTDIYGTPLIVTGLLGTLSYSVGAILFGIAIWRSGLLPRWTGIAVALAGPLISFFGLFIGVTQTIGSLLLTIATVAIAMRIQKSE
jgi:hypothetical protein